MHPTVQLRDVIAGGVPGTEMVAWSQANGGLLDDRTLDDLALLVTGWRTVAQPSPTPVTLRAASVPIQLGPWVLPFSAITLVSFTLTLTLLAIGYLRE